MLQALLRISQQKVSELALKKELVDQQQKKRFVATAKKSAWANASKVSQHSTETALRAKVACAAKEESGKPEQQEPRPTRSRTLK